jgi:Outer membrane protein and related peptidoglycan-associated (lipo)proteins
MIAEALKDISDKTIVLVKGHTDASGEASQNKKLSQKRADSVMLYLKKGGLDSLNMKAIGYGEGQPIVVSNPNDKLNRRVEIELKRGE